MTAVDHDLLRDWTEIQKNAGEDWRLPDLSFFSVETGVEAVDPVAVEREARSAVESNRGWLRYQSAAFEGSRDTKGEELWSGDFDRPGRLLFAEWFDADGSTSYRLIPDPAWPGRAKRYVYRESASPRDGWDRALAQEVALQGFNGCVLRYRVFWGAPAGDPSAFRRLFARLVRIERPAS